MLFQSIGFRPRSMKSLIRLFDAADATGDGVLEFDEFIIMQRQLKALSSTHRLFDVAAVHLSPSTNSANKSSPPAVNKNVCRRRDLYMCMALHHGGFDTCDGFGGRSGDGNNNSSNSASQMVETSTSTDSLLPLPPPLPNINTCGEKMKMAFGRPSVSTPS